MIQDTEKSTLSERLYEPLQTRTQGLLLQEFENGCTRGEINQSELKGKDKKQDHDRREFGFVPTRHETGDVL